MQREKDLAELEKRLKIPFLNKQLLNQSLTHSSFAHEENVPDNERLEFLGDAVIKLAVTEYLYHKFPTRPEGDLTKIRAAVISDDTLAKIAGRVRIGEYLLLSKNEKKTGGDKRKSNVANVFEALVGAIYIDAGLGKARDFIIEFLKAEIDKVSKEGYIKDYKSALQEFVQKKRWGLPQYKVIKEIGPRHEKIFIIAVKIKGRDMGEGKGGNKKEAEQFAAEEALKKLKQARQDFDEPFDASTLLSAGRLRAQGERKKPHNPIKGILHRVRKSIWL